MILFLKLGGNPTLNLSHPIIYMSQKSEILSDAKIP